MPLNPYPSPPPKRKPSSPIAKKLQKPARRPNKMAGNAHNPMPRPARGGQGQMDDMSHVQKPYRRPVGQQMPRPSGRGGSSSTSGGAKRKPTGTRQAPASKMMPKKKVGFYGQRPVGRGKGLGR